MGIFKLIRIILLFGILISTAIYAKHQFLYTHGWYEPITVVIYPINGDNEPSTQNYIDQLDEDAFQAIDDFFEKHSEKFDLITNQPFTVKLGKQVNQVPPENPGPGSSKMDAALWSLKFRYWSFKNTPDDESNQSRIRMFTIYHKAEPGKRLSHSTGLEKGLIGIVHAFADKNQTRQNHVVIAHEILHTVGASDKYDATGMPMFPEGYANPKRTPLHPQSRAEIMAGSIPIADGNIKMPESLRHCVIGTKTASEIAWIGTE